LYGLNKSKDGTVRTTTKFLHRTRIQLFTPWLAPTSAFSDLPPQSQVTATNIYSTATTMLQEGSAISS